MTTRIFSGIQPTGELHLGNYYGAVQNWVELQDQHECFYCVVDYHAITGGIDPKGLPTEVVQLARDLIACGIDPARSTLFVQSHVPEHTELAWIFSAFASYGDLARMTQFKDKADRSSHVNAGLFVYPVLQASDILLYRPGGVPVGVDQSQHLELTRRIARRFNQEVGADFFPEVKTLLSQGRRIMSLADPERKMSKSLGNNHYIGLMEPSDSITKKIRSAVTSVGGVPGEASPGVANLLFLLRLLAEPRVANELADREQRGKLMYGHLKDEVTEHLLESLRPIRERREGMAESEVRDHLRDGAERARAFAVETMSEVRRLIGVGSAGEFLD